MSLKQTLTEVSIVQNPALGAYGIWRFGASFQKTSALSPTVPHVFLVLALLLHQKTLDVIGTTRPSSGLSLFAAKLAERREDLLSVHERCLALRSLTLQSIAVASARNLVSVNYETAAVRANGLDERVEKFHAPERLTGYSNGAEKLGLWFSRMTLSQIVSTLRVEL